MIGPNSHRPREPSSHCDWVTVASRCAALGALATRAAQRGPRPRAACQLPRPMAVVGRNRAACHGAFPVTPRPGECGGRRPEAEHGGCDGAWDGDGSVALAG